MNKTAVILTTFRGAALFSWAGIIFMLILILNIHKCNPAAQIFFVKIVYMALDIGAGMLVTGLILSVLYPVGCP